MISHANQNPSTCAVCGLPCTLAELLFTTSGKSTLALTSTHSMSLVDADNVTRLADEDAFFADLHALAADFDALDPADKALSYGSISALAFGPVRPEACNVRVDCRPVFTVTAFSRSREVPLSVRAGAGLVLADLLAEVAADAEAAALAIKADVDAGL